MNDNSSNNSHEESIVLSDVGQLIVGIPPVLGFHPVNSLVVIGLQGSDDSPLVSLMLRTNLPEPADRDQVATQLVYPLRLNRIPKAALVVIGDRDPDSLDLPHRALLTTCQARFAMAGIAVVEQVWAASTRCGEPWQCYQHRSCGGLLPDPRSSVLAAASVAAGVVTHDMRDDLVATLAPAPDDVLARRADLLAAAIDDDGEQDAGADRLGLVTAAIGRALDGVLPESDEDIVALGLALADRRVRDACLAPEDGVEAEVSERLWTCLTRGLPAPERAEAACLLAFAAYQRGDGVLAGIALDLANAADPGHRLADLLRSALQTGVPPHRLREAARQASAASRDGLTSRSDGRLP